MKTLLKRKKRFPTLPSVAEKGREKMKKLKIIVTIILCMCVIGIQAQKSKNQSQKTNSNSEALDLSKLSEVLNSDEVKNLGNQLTKMMGKLNEQTKNNDNGETKKFNDIILEENGKKISLVQTFINASKEVNGAFNKAMEAEKARYKKMSYQEFKEEFKGAEFPDGVSKDAVTRELYNEMQKNDGDIIKAVSIVSERHKK